jgi:ubiquinone/menaquinone biosynthesis C-methylase UbiE
MEIFDLEARSYDEWYNQPLGKFVDEVETSAIFELLKPMPNENILDVGCGTGNYSVMLAKLGCKVTGIDVSTEMLKVAREKAEKLCLNVNFINCDAQDLPFESNFFDAVLSVATFEFIPNPHKAFEELYRVVKQGGRIVIGFINKESPWGELYESEEFKKNTVFKYAHLFTKKEISKIKPDALVDIIETLYTPPTADVNELSFEFERTSKNKFRGGFLVAKWKKR